MQLAVREHLITGETGQALATYVAFRHFFVHAYALDLDAERLDALLENIDTVFDQVKQDLAQFLKE